MGQFWDENCINDGEWTKDQRINKNVVFWVVVSLEEADQRRGGGGKVGRMGKLWEGNRLEATTQMM